MACFKYNRAAFSKKLTGPFTVYFEDGAPQTAQDVRKAYAWVRRTLSNTPVNKALVFHARARVRDGRQIVFDSTRFGRRTQSRSLVLLEGFVRKRDIEDVRNVDLPACR